MVLNLRSVQGTLNGKLSRPRHHASLGSSLFSNISSEVITEPVMLLPRGHASLQESGFPNDPLTLIRVPVSPIQSVATDWDLHRAYYPDETEQSNPRMQRIFDEDQKDRTTINTQDEQRRKQVRELLSRGALHTGKDFEQAAVIFQHGSTPDDRLLAHTLAMIAVARGNPGALWIASATLDRYLNSIK